MLLGPPHISLAFPVQAVEQRPSLTPEFSGLMTFPAPYCTCIGLTTLACEAGVDEWTNSIGILLRALITLSSYWLLTMYVRIMYSESKAKGTVFAESSLLSERK